MLSHIANQIPSNPLKKAGLQSTKNNKNSMIDFSNFKMPLSSIGKKIKEFLPADKLSKHKRS